MSWFEEVEIGRVSELGTFTFTEEDIVRFARTYDPQPFHIDPVAAKDGPFGGLVASGWHTVAVWMKLMMAHRNAQLAEKPPSAPGERQPQSGPSPGFLDMRWPTPVRAGDEISYRSTVVEKVDLKSRPQWGIVRSRNEGFNQNGDQVLHFIGQGLMEKRDA